MSRLNFQAVQKVINLDVPYPSFSTWHEKLEFVVDGIVVKAIVIHEWRRITIQITEPFELLASTFEPPLIALGAAMLSRQASLKKRGVTETEDYISKAKDAYLRHVTYLRLKPQIDATQEEFLTRFSGKLESRLLLSDTVRARITLEKSTERVKFKAGEISQQHYQASLKSLEAQSIEALLPYSNLKYKIDRELEDIKHSMVDKALADSLKSH